MMNKRHVHGLDIDLVKVSQIMDCLELDNAIMLARSHSTEVFLQKPSLQSANAESNAGTSSVT